ncbi:MAG: hypothetical protein H6644_02025 [Caldilineaceae bacterium]|nr:hypothetical protein [Caldilineaceae bacterium]
MIVSESGRKISTSFVVTQDAVLRPGLRHSSHAYSRDEWEAMMMQKHLIVLEALNDGKVLHGERLFAQWRQRFREGRNSL